jgi:hypothetical protein
MVETLKNNFVGSSYLKYRYAYDNVGNITGVWEQSASGSETKKESYEYDSLNQLTVNVSAAQGKKYVYT